MLDSRQKSFILIIATATLVAVVAFAPVLPAAGVIWHTVQSGDTLSAIAKQYSTTVTVLAQSNSLANPNLIVVGQKLRIPTGDGILYTIKAGDTLWDIATRQGISLAALKEANPHLDPKRLAIGSTITVPAVGDRLLASRQGTAIALAWPLTGRISSSFGWRTGRMHQGLDIAASSGQLITAPAPGQVVSTGWCGGYGQRVIVDHGRGLKTLYAHCSTILVKPGDKVQSGQGIARVGATGNATGPHLHFEVHVGGRPYDPLQFLK